MEMRKKLVSLLAAFGLIAAGLTVMASPAYASACTPNPCYYYAGFRQTVDFDGVSLLLGKENPATDANTWHSLAELTAQDATGANIVEVGWTKDPLVCASGVTVCLFAGIWKNSVFQGYNTNFTNGTGCSPYCIGASL